MERTTRGGPDYLPTLRTSIVAGRNFEPGEGADSDVAIIDRDLARFFWSDQSPIGRRFQMSESGKWLTVVGLVDDLMLGMPDGSYGKHALLRPASPTHDGTYFAIRTAGDPDALLPAIRQAVFATDPHRPIYSLTTARGASHRGAGNLTAGTLRCTRSRLQADIKE